jgi:hypothetical protein
MRELRGGSPRRDGRPQPRKAGQPRADPSESAADLRARAHVCTPRRDRPAGDRRRRTARVLRSSSDSLHRSCRWALRDRVRHSAHGRARTTSHGLDASWGRRRRRRVGGRNSRWGSRRRRRRRLDRGRSRRGDRLGRNGGRIGRGRRQQEKRIEVALRVGGAAYAEVHVRNRQLRHAARADGAHDVAFGHRCAAPDAE